MTNTAFGDVLGAALRDTWPALKSWIWWLVVVFVLLVGALFAVGVVNAATDLPTSNTAWQVEAVFATGIPCTIAAFFSLASAVRTVRPEFRMTVGRFFGVIGWTLVAALAIMAGFICLVIPGLYLTVKLSFVPYFYLLGEQGDNPMATSWNRTRGCFWYTALMLIAVTAIAETLSYAGGFAFGGLAAISRPAALVAMPFLLTLFFAAFQCQYNAYVRWADSLLTADPV